MSLLLTSLPFKRKLAHAWKSRRQIFWYPSLTKWPVTGRRGLCTPIVINSESVVIGDNRIAISVELNRIRTMIDRLSYLGKGRGWNINQNFDPIRVLFELIIATWFRRNVGSEKWELRELLISFENFFQWMNVNDGLT